MYLKDPGNELLDILSLELLNFLADGKVGLLDGIRGIDPLGEFLTQFTLC